MSTMKLSLTRFIKSAPISLELRNNGFLPVSRLAVIIILSIATMYGLYKYGYLTRQISQKELKMQLAQQRLNQSIKPLKLNPTEEAALQKALKNLDYPWQTPFQLIEFATVDNVTLIEVRPEIEKREIRILAQATDLTAMFDYARQLKKSAHTRRVTLNSEEIQEDDVQPILFTLTVSW